VPSLQGGETEDVPPPLPPEVCPPVFVDSKLLELLKTVKCILITRPITNKIASVTEIDYKF